MLAYLISRTSSDLWSLLYPKYCAGCRDALQYTEKVICTNCRIQLPRTNFKAGTGNQIEKHFWGKVEVESAVAFLQFLKGTEVMHLLHELKYRGNQDVGKLLGRMFASEYGNSDFLSEIDYIIPVPLHERKLKIRGFNQCDSICNGISEITKLPVLDSGLKRNRFNETQTSKGRFERFTNTSGLFSVNSTKLEGKRVLLIDDVITTGSTLEACINPLNEIGCSVRVAAMASPLD